MRSTSQVGKYEKKQCKERNKTLQGHWMDKGISDGKSLKCGHFDWKNRSLNKKKESFLLKIATKRIKNK